MNKMEKPERKLVLVGHVDHGKSTLIGRLLYDSGSLKPEKIEEVKKTSEELGEKELNFAFFTDNLKEEREEGKTIDIFRTKFESKYSYTLIDCPGHKEFVKNMLTGASRADSALLILSAKADEGIQEQTKRHLFLLKMLGIKTLFVAINKMDTVDYSEKRFNEMKNNLLKFLRKIGFKGEIPFVPISAKKGDNILKNSKNLPWYSGKSLLEIINSKITDNPPPKFLRAVVQGGYNRIILSKIESGTIHKNEEVYFNLGEFKTTIKEILQGIDSREKASQGESVGLKIFPEKEILRGEVISKIDNKPIKTTEFTGKIFVLEEFKKHTPLSLRCGFLEVPADFSIIKKISSTGEEISDFSEDFEATEAAEVKISLKKPIILEKFSKFEPLGRFLLLSENKILAMGVINEK